MTIMRSKSDEFAQQWDDAFVDHGESALLHPTDGPVPTLHLIRDLAPQEAQFAAQPKARRVARTRRQTARVPAAARYPGRMAGTSRPNGHNPTQ